MADEEKITLESAIRFNQADRIGWVTKMSIREIIRILPTRQNEQLHMLTETNRPISKPQLQGIIDFLENTNDWALPGIVLAVDSGNVEQNAKGNGTVTIPKEKIRILDGQHRVHALSEAVRNATVSLEQGRENPDRLDLLQESELPVAVLEVRDVRDQQQIFAWFSRSKPIEAHTREWFDRSDPFNNAAKTAMEESTALRERVNNQASRTKSESRGLLTLMELKDIAITIALGIRRKPKPADRDEYFGEEKQTELQENITGFFDRFLQSCREHYASLENEDRTQDRFHFERRNTYALDPQAMKLFANCWARVEPDQNLDPAGLARAIGRLNLNRSDPENDFFTTLHLVSENEKYVKPTDKEWTQATMTLLQMSREE